VLQDVVLLKNHVINVLENVQQNNYLVEFIKVSAHIQLLHNLKNVKQKEKDVKQKLVVNSKKLALKVLVEFQKCFVIHIVSHAKLLN